jgi:hypothetical protein
VEETELMDVATLAQLLHEAAERHHPYEQSAPDHDWWDWYAPYIDARQNGSSPEEAATAAGRDVEGVRRGASR